MVNGMVYGTVRYDVVLYGMTSSPEVWEHARGEDDEDDRVPGDARQQHQHKRRVELFGDAREPDASRNKDENQKGTRGDKMRKEKDIHTEEGIETREEKYIQERKQIN